MINEQSLHHHQPHDHVCTKKCISWTAIFVGALVGVGLSFLLNVFSAAISLSVFSMSSQGGATFAIGGLIGVIIGVVVAMYVAGWVSGYLGRPYCTRRNLGILYGFVAWCVALIITTLLASKLMEHTIAYSNFITSPTSMVEHDMMRSTPTPATTATARARAAVHEARNTTPQEDVITGFSVGAFIVFALFYIGAFAACVGGYYGMLYKGDEQY
jgi:MFS family permease